MSAVARSGRRARRKKCGEMLDVIRIKYEASQPFQAYESVSVARGVSLVRYRDAYGKWHTQSFEFGKEAGFDLTKAKKWLTRHAPVVREEFAHSILNVRQTLRAVLQYDLKLCKEWRRYYLEGLDSGVPNTFAWLKFRERYQKNSEGHWMRRKNA